MRRKVGAARPKAAVGRKKATRKKPRRRGIGAAGSLTSMLIPIAGLTVGAGGIRWLVTKLSAFLPFLASSQLIDGAFQIALGAFLPRFVKGQFMQFVGYGMMASGGQTILVGTGLISGAMPMSYQVGGVSNLRVIGGTGGLKVVGSPGTNRISNPPAVGAPIRAKGFSHYGKTAA